MRHRSSMQGCCHNISIFADVTNDEKKKITAFVDQASDTVNEYFGVRNSFDIIICRGGWEMEVQIISREKRFSTRGSRQTYMYAKSTGVTDYKLQEIIIRIDTAKFGHFLHEIIHGIICSHYPHQLKEALAWYFTLKLTESCKYVRPAYPIWVDQLYIYPMNKLVRIVGDDFLKRLAVGSAELEVTKLPSDVQTLFLPPHLFYKDRS